MRFFHLAGLLGLVSIASAQTPHGKQLCMASCQEALDYITFPDVTAAQVALYYPALCESPLRTQSIYMCAKLYCDPEELVAGNNFIQTYCGNNARAPPPYKDPGMSRDELRKMALDGQVKFHSGDTINSTIIPGREKYDLTYETLETWYYQLHYDYQYAWAMYVFWGGVALISLLAKGYGRLTAKSSRPTAGDAENASIQKTPSFLGRMNVKLNYMLITPAALGRRSAEPYGWFTVPPLVQSLTILSFIVINVVFCSIPYHLFKGNTYWPDQTDVQIWRYFADRTGILAFANLPILWLFGTRNNLLLWLTGWSPATFNSFHRWVARLATIEAVLHSIAYTVNYFDSVDGAALYYSSFKEGWWNYGVVATIFMSVICSISVYGLRKRAYDLFLVLHIVFAFVILLACFYHVKLDNHIYTRYLWATVAVWGFDRLARVVRIIMLNYNRFSNGQSATASYSEGSNIISLDVPIATSLKHTPGSFYYIYVLHGWMPYQSHPFTSSFRLASYPKRIATPDSGSPQYTEYNKEVNVKADSTSSGSSSSTAVTIDYSQLRFHIRPFSGFTSKFRDLVVKSEGKPNQIRVLVEGPYGSIEPVHNFDNLLFLVGGSGVTVALQYLQALLTKKREGKATPKIHMIWVVRQTWMLSDLGSEVCAYEQDLGIKFTVHATGNRGLSASKEQHEMGDPDLEIAGWPVVRGRPDLNTAVRNERSDVIGSLAVVSCCPPSMADDSRFAVVKAMRATQLNIEYFQESFSW